MNRKLMTIRTLHPAAGALLALAMCGGAAAAEPPNVVDETVRWQQQEEVRRQMADRERAQQEALRGQEEAIRRLEDARRRLETSTREVAELSGELGRNAIITYRNAYGAVGTPRALLGVSVETSGDRRDGALVRQVSPGGAAAEAGIRPGDLIVSLGGEDLTRDSNPGRALVEKMNQIEPDTKVQVGVLRDGKRQNFEITARAAAAPFLPAPGQRTEQYRLIGDILRDAQRDNPRIVGTESGTMRIEPLGSGVVAYAEANRLGGMEFATISERLGGYFGVKSGVLVVRAGADSPFSLQDGDVILSIDGRTPTNAQHAGRILRSYQPGEKVKLRVQRDRKAMDIDSVAPGGRKQ